mmetsp:Transcript_25354/g.58973  ORF Transcript_25354/g.58973 Transcript_25354/m.58973 type:complete len:110 (-) Transcript_25354:36-365(-)
MANLPESIVNRYKGAIMHARRRVGCPCRPSHVTPGRASNLHDPMGNGDGLSRDCWNHGLMMLSRSNEEITEDVMDDHPINNIHQPPLSRVPGEKMTQCFRDVIVQRYQG